MKKMFEVSKKSLDASTETAVQSDSQPPETASQWHLAKRIGFRFVFAYLVL